MSDVWELIADLSVSYSGETMMIPSAVVCLRAIQMQQPVLFFSPEQRSYQIHHKLEASVAGPPQCVDSMVILEYNLSSLLGLLKVLKMHIQQKVSREGISLNSSTYVIDLIKGSKENTSAILCANM